MSTIHMDVDAARNLQKKIVQLRSSIEKVMASTNNIVMGLPQTWRARSATEFMDYYRESAGNIDRTLEPLAEIAADLLEEIERMERMAERLSD